MAAESQLRQNYHENCEAGINKMVHLELCASYVYHSMAHHFDRDDVALPGFYKFFSKQSEEEREHANKLMKYQNKRGGRLVLQDIKKPEREEWGTSHQAMQAALELEKKTNASLLDLHGVAETHQDHQMMDFIESEYLHDKVKNIKRLSDYVTQLKEVGPGLGEFIFDKETLQ